MKRFWLTLICASVMAVPGHAQTNGRAALEEWIGEYRKLGFEITYDAIDEAGDALALRNLRVGHQATMALPEHLQIALPDIGINPDDSFTASELGIELTMHYPAVVFEGVSAGKEGFSAREMECRTDCRMSVELRFDGGAPIVIDMTMTNYRNADWFEPRLAEAASKDKKSFGDWLPLLRLSKAYRLGEVSVERMEGTFETPKLLPEMTAFYGSFVNSDIRMAGLENGRAAEYSVGLQQSETTTRIGDEERVEKSSLNSTRVTGLNYGAWIDLFDPDVPASETYVDIIESAFVENHRMESADSDVAMGSYGIEGLSVRYLGVDFFTLFTNLPVDTDSDPSKGFGLFLDWSRAFAVDRFFINDLTMHSRESDVPVELKLGQVLLSNLSADGLEEFSFSDIDVNVVDVLTARYDRFVLGNIVFPPYGPVRAFIDDPAQWENPDGLDVARIFAPHSLSISAEGFSMEGDALPAPFKLERSSLDMKSLVPPIPTSIDYVVDGLEFPATVLDDEEVEAVFEVLGLKTIRNVDELKLRWDEASGDVILDSLVFEIGGIARVEAAMRLGGIPRFLLEDPKQFEAAIVTANIKSGWLRIRDLGGMEKGIALRASNTGASEEDVIDFIRSQLTEALQPLQNQEFTERVTQAVDEFVRDPGTLTVTIAPERPVPVAQVAAGVMSAPQALPEMLGIGIEAGR